MQARFLFLLSEGICAEVVGDDVGEDGLSLHPAQQQ